MRPEQGLAVDPEAKTQGIAAFIARAVRELEKKGAAFGLSGGLDLAVVACPCVRALSPRRVRALILPERDSDPRSLEDARGARPLPLALG